MAELPDDVEALKELLRERTASLHMAQHRIKMLEETIRLFQRKQFGPSSERWEGQPCLFNEAEASEADTEALRSKVEAHERHRPKRKPLPADLPRIDHVYTLDADEAQCDCCGKMLKEIGEEISEQLDIIPAKVQVLRHRRKKYACPSCKESVKTAPLPQQPLPKTNASPGLLAYVATAKYVDGLPLYRQEEVLRRIGIDMARSTLSRWMIDLAEVLRPLYNLLEDDLLSSNVLLMDETPIQVLKGTGKKPTSDSFMWVRCRAGPDKPIVLFHYDPSRGKQVAFDLLAGFSGHLVTDGYEVYASLAAQREEINHCGCWDHARRRFDEAVKAQKDSSEPSFAAAGLSYIQALYEIERNVKGMNKEKRLSARQLYARSVLDHLKRWLERARPVVAPKSLTGKALDYLHNEWSRLIRYLEDGDIPISNALAENAIRPFAIGRKNWLFSDTRQGAEASAILYSIVETAKANDLEPYAYLKHVIAQLPGMTTADQMVNLLPYKIKA